jgi:hypothetical protein
MATGSVFAKFYNKKIAGFTDFGPRMLDYLKELNRDSVQARFDVDGVFNTPHGLSGGVNTVSVTGSSRETDGLGHTMRVSSSAFGVSALFQNTAAVVYHVGLRYCEIPIGISVNPRTGLPEYASFKEEIGESGVPNSVVNNGSTLTLVVDNVTESGVSNAGRTVRVYKLVPAPGATTEAIAIEDCTVAWDGSNNKITTAALLGQSVVSTTAADYVVVMMGITVKRNTNLESSPNHCFIGTVTGVGAGGTPVTFDTSLQRLVKTFTDATQILFTPYSWLTHTNVQAALQDVVDVLGDAGTSNPGATRIGTNPVAFSKAKPTAYADGGGGIGTVADGTFPTVKDLQTVLQKIDAALNRHRGWTKTFGGDRGLDLGTSTTNNLRTDGVSTSATKGGTYWLQGISGYTLGNMVDTVGPYVLGESQGDPSADLRTKIELSNTASATDLHGHWSRVYFDDGPDPTAGFQSRGVSLDNVTLNGGLFRQIDLQSSNDVDRIGVRFQQVSIHGTHRTLNPGALTIGPQQVGGLHDGVYWGTYEDCHVESESGASATLSLLHTTGIAIDALFQKKVYFRNSHFFANANHPVLSDTDSVNDIAYELVFDGCSFQANDSFLTSTAFVTLLKTKRVTFRDCVFHDRGGNGIFLSGAIIDSCRFFVGKISQVSNRKRIELTSCSVSKSFITIYDCGTTNTQVVDIVGGTISGLNIVFDNAGDVLSTSQSVKISSNCQVDNLFVGFNGGQNGTAADSNAFLMDSSVGNNIRIIGCPAGRSGANSSADYVLFTFCDVTNLKTSISGSTLSNSYNSTCKFSQCAVRNFRPTTSAIPKVPGGSGPFRVESGTHVDGWRMTTGPWRATSSGTAGIILAFGKNRLSKVDYKENTGAVNDALISSSGDYNTITDCMLTGGQRDGLFGGSVIITDGDRDIIMGNTIEWSPASNAAGNFAVKTTGDYPSVNNNTFVKDTTGTDFTDIHFEHFGTGSNDLDNNVNFLP